MLSLIFALSVSRDAGVVLQDTGALDLFFLEKVFLNHAGDFMGVVSSSGGYVLAYRDSILHIQEGIEAYDENTGIFVSATPYHDPSGLEHYILKIFNYAVDKELPVALYDVPAPSSDYTAAHQVVQKCGNAFCAMLVFSDYVARNSVVLVHRFDDTSIDEIFSGSFSGVVNSAGLYGFVDDYPDTAFAIFSIDNDVYMLGLDLNLPSSDNPVISYSGHYPNTYYYVAGGGLFDDGSRAVFMGILSSTDSIAFIGFDLNTASVVDERYYAGAYYKFSLYADGICGAYGDGSSLYMLRYDVFSGNFYAASVSYTENIIGSGLYSGTDACIFLATNGLVAVDPVILSIADLEIIPSMVDGVLNDYSHSDISSFGNSILLFYYTSPLPDTLIATVYDYTGGFVTLSSDTIIPNNVPSKMTVFDLQFRDNGLVGAVSSILLNPTLLKLGENLAFQWRADTLSSFQYVYLPAYVYLMNYGSEEIRKIDLSAGLPLSYSYSIPSTPYGSVVFMKEVNDKLFVLSGTGSQSYIHVLDTATLTGLELVNLGSLSTSWVVDVNEDGNYMVMLLSNYTSRVGYIYVYDFDADNLVGPYVVDFDASSTEYPVRVLMEGDTVFALFGTSLDNRILKCHAGLASCSYGSVDVSYGNINGLYVFRDSIYMTTTGGYIAVMDRQLNVSHIFGPLNGVVMSLNRLGDYVALVVNKFDVMDTTFVEFRRIGDLNVVDYADTVVGYTESSTELHEYSPGQYYLYVALSGQFASMSRVYRYNVTSSVGRDEVSSGIRYSVSNGRLVLEGRGYVELNLYNTAGRLLGSYRGNIDGRVAALEIPGPGIYLLDMNGRRYKVLNLKR